MKKLISIFILLPFIISAQTVQKGIVLEYNGAKPKTPLAYVSVSVPNETNPTTSDSKGNYELNFMRLRVGDKVPVVQISRAEYVLFNKDAIEQWKISTKSDFNIVMCKKSVFDKMVSFYYGISTKSQEEQYKKDLEKLEKLKKENEAEYYRQYNELYDKYQKEKEERSKIADLFARIDESELNKLDSTALMLIKSGKVDEAIKIYQEAHLIEKFEQAQQKKRVGQELYKQGESEIKTTESSLNNYINSLKLKGGEDSYKELYDIYYRKAMVDTTNYECLSELAKFLSEQGKINESLKWYRQCLNIAPTSLHKAIVLNEIGVNQIKIDLLNDAADSFLKSFELLNKQIKDSTISEFNILENMIISLQNQSLLISTFNNKDSSECNLIFCKEKIEQILPYDSITFRPMLANVLSNLAVVQLELGKYLEADSTINQSISVISKVLIDNKHDETDDLFIKILNNKALICYKLEKYNESLSFYNNAIKRCKECLEKNPNKYNHLYAQILANIGQVFEELSNYDEALLNYNKSIEIYHLLESVEPKRIKKDYAVVLNYKGILLKNIGYLSESELLLSKSLLILNNLTIENPEVYMPTTALILNNLGFVQMELNKFDSAEVNIKKSINILQSLPLDASKVYKTDLAQAFDNLGVLYLKKEKYILAEDNIIKGLAINKELYQKDQNVYFQDLAKSYNNFACVLLMQKKYDLAARNYFDAISVSNTQDSKNISIQCLDILQCSYIGLGNLYYYTNQHDRSEAYYLLANKLDTVNYLTKKNLSNVYLASLYYNLKQYDQSEYFYEKTLADIKYLMSFDSLSYNLAYAQRANELAVLQYDILSHYDKAELNYIDALQIYNKLNKYSIENATINNNLALLYKTNKQYIKAEKYYIDAIDIVKELCKNDSLKYNLSYALKLNDLAVFQIDILKKYIDAQTNLEIALPLFMQLFKKDYKTNSLNLAVALKNLGLTQFHQGNYTMAKSNFNESINTFKKLDIDIKLSVDIAQLYSDIGYLCELQNETKEAAENYQKSVDFYQDLSRSDSIYYSIFADKLNSLAWLQYRTNLYAAITNTEKALLIYENLSNSKLESDYIICLARMSRYKIFDNQFSEAEYYSKKAYLMNSNSKVAKKNYAHSLLFTDNFEIALKLYSELIKDSETKSQIIEDFNEFEKAGLENPYIEKIRTILN